MNWQSDVSEFHAKFNLPVSTIPADIEPERANLRLQLHEEEMDEVKEAVLNGDIVEVADGIAYLIYVLLGTAVEFGIDMNPIWDEVQRTNMAKEGGGVRGDGKILKPEGWEPPRIKEILQSQGWKL